MVYAQIAIAMIYGHLMVLMPPMLIVLVVAFVFLGIVHWRYPEARSETGVGLIVGSIFTAAYSWALLTMSPPRRGLPLIRSSTDRTTCSRWPVTSTRVTQCLHRAPATTAIASAHGLANCQAIAPLPASLRLETVVRTRFGDVHAPRHTPVDIVAICDDNVVCVVGASRDKTGLELRLWAGPIDGSRLRLIGGIPQGVTGPNRCE